MIGVYQILNKVNGKYYIGSSKDIQKRFKSHIKALTENSHNNKYLQNAWNKYGKDNFEFVVLEETKLDNLRDKENYYITSMNATNHQFGYNMLNNTNIGLGVSASDEVKLKISNACKGNKNGHYGKKHSNETRLLISRIKKEQGEVKKQLKLNQWIEEQHKCEICDCIMTIKYGSGRFCSKQCANKSTSLKNKQIKHTSEWNNNIKNSLKGQHFSEEHCKAISRNAKERMKNPKNNPMYGRKHSEETKQKISDTLKSMKIDSERFTGHSHSIDSRKKISESLKLAHQQKLNWRDNNDKQ